MTSQTKSSTLIFIIILLLSFNGCTKFISSPNENNISPTVATTQLYTPSIDTLSLDEQINNLLSQYGWSIKTEINSYEIVLPSSFQHYPGDFPNTIYWAYNNEFNKELGLNLTPYLGQTVLSKYYLLNEPLPEEFYPDTKAYAVVITFQNKIIGAWIDKGRHYGFALSLNKKEFDEIVNDEWSDWLMSSGVIDISNPTDIELSTKTPEEIIRIYYDALSTGNKELLRSVQTRESLTGLLFINKEENLLFNLEYDRVTEMALNNIKSANLLNLEKLGFDSECSLVYGALVDFQFINPHISTYSDGTNYRVLVLKEEISGLGWRVNGNNSWEGYTNECVQNK